MKMINRLIEPSEGEIEIDGVLTSETNIHELRWNIGYVLQQIALFPNMTVAENIAVVPEMLHWKKGQIQDRVDELLEMVGLVPKQYKERKPSELSGGQQQRIGVARALAANPDIILMDEPFSALDPISREQLQVDIQSLQRDIQKTIVFVTHDMDEALKLGDRICLMREGEVVQVGSPEELLQHPKNDFVKQFIGGRRQSSQAISKALKVSERLKPVDPAGQEPDLEVRIDANETLEQAFSLLKSLQASRLAVTENGAVIGTISYEEIAHALIEEGTQ